MSARSATARDGRPRLVVRVKLGADASFGPGKAALLEALDRLGSISAAARAMDMSYRQAWMLVETMNQTFRAPVITTTQGGVRGGGATLTPLGRRLVATYRSLQHKAAASVRHDLVAIMQLTAPIPSPAPRRTRTGRRSRARPTA